MALGQARSASSGPRFPCSVRIALIAQVVDVFQTTDGPQAAIREVADRSGTWFDPELAEVSRAVFQREHFWQALVADDLDQRLFALAPAQHEEVLTDEYLDEIVAAFAQVVVDLEEYPALRAIVTASALFADMIAEAMGMSATERTWL